MKKVIVIVFVLLFNIARADEGMWIPSLLKLLNESDMQSKGLKLTAEDLYSINKSSLKDAVVHFGGGCTAEIVSDQGLIFTNHHCGLSQIQAHSSVEKDYLKNGFWAMDRSQELPGQGLTATFIVRIDDVTQKVFEGIDLTAGDANRKIIAQVEKLEREAVAGTHYEADIKPFNYGNSYFMIITETFKDVRLVGAPPQAIGEYGGDTDNWMWPRHTGDFSVFRIYAGKDNKPAEYSADNVPYKPKHVFPVSTQGVEENDFTFVYGFPGRTQQFLTSFEVDFVANKSNPAKISMRDKALEVIDVAMASADRVRIQYASKQSRISNSNKKWKGESRGLKKIGALEKKKTFESEFMMKVYANPAFTNKYGTILEDMKSLYNQNEKLFLSVDYFNEFISSGPEIIKYTANFEKIAETYKELKEDKKDEEVIERLKRSTTAFFKNYDVETDKKIFKAMLPLYLEGTAPEYLPSIIKDLEKEYNKDWNKAIDELYKNSIFANETKVNALFTKFGTSTVSKIKNDPAYLLMKALYDNYRSKMDQPYKMAMGLHDSYMNNYVEGITKIFKDRKTWFDANSTLRVSYGKVEGSYPKDGVAYVYYTTAEGLIEKYNTGLEEYKLPQRLIDLINQKDFGGYDEDGELRLCFTASNHTTGGNSGSPVLNGEGELIGINFDRSWESTMSDIMYSPELCRNIIVDIRYVLFIIDKYAGASHLIKELKITNAATKEQARKDKISAEIRDLSEQIAINADNAVLLTQRAQKYYELGLNTDAFNNLQIALKSKSDYAPALILSGELLMQKQQYNAAIKEFDKVLLKDKGNVDAAIKKIEANFNLKNYETVVKETTRLIDAGNNQGKLYLWRAKSKFILGQPGVCSDLDKAKISGVNVNTEADIYQCEIK